MASPIVLRPRPEDVEGQPILRPLPSAQCRSVGPFVFFDHILSNRYAPGTGMNVRQHPHIGLSTLSYLFEGALLHKDSLGSDQYVAAGDVSYMTAGSGVAHVERTPAELWQSGSQLHGLQLWLALPKHLEQGTPSYSHHAVAELPESEVLGVRIRLVAGEGFCLKSPVPVPTPTLLADIHMSTGAAQFIAAEHQQRALYLVSGEARLEDQALQTQSMLVLPEGETYTLFAESDCQVIMVGGEALDGPRRMNWNFVASDSALIDQAREKWAARDWPTVAGETERIELPR
jgi:redox-sensitive bicupin YhaK (pirin superfamily)